jgi:GntR family transcriptional regulator, vanillate catabolism transcriptional regulator
LDDIVLNGLCQSIFKTHQYCMQYMLHGRVLHTTKDTLTMTTPENPAEKPLSADDVSHSARTLLRLREMLFRGEFQRGERLSEIPLGARLGVSRTPVRLALERLAHEGLLEASRSGGFVVREFTVDAVWDAIEVRGVLEGTAARLAAERLDNDRELDILRQYRDELDSIKKPALNEDSFSRYLDVNEKFHSEIVRLAKNEMLQWTLDRVISLPFASPSALLFARSKLPGAADMHAIGQEQHRAIVEAIENQHGTRAESLSREHARLSRRNLELVLTDSEILSCVPGSSLIKP